MKKISILVTVLSVSLPAFSDIPGESRQYSRNQAPASAALLKVNPMLGSEDETKDRFMGGEYWTSDHRSALEKLKGFGGSCTEDNMDSCVDSAGLNAFLTEGTPESVAANEILAKNSQNVKPEKARPGFVKMSGEQQATVNWLKYYLALDDSLWIPFYILSTTPSNEKSTDEVEANLLDRNGGVLNFKYASSRGVYPFGLCHFESSRRGGCYLAWEAGAKIISLDDKEGNADYEYAGYGSAGFDFEFPIFPDMAERPVAGKEFKVDPAGNFLIGASANALYSNTDKIKDFYLINGEMASLKIDEETFYIDWRVSFNITSNISIEAGGVALSSSDVLDKNRYFRVNYNLLTL